jgi:hypothetical protein
VKISVVLLSAALVLGVTAVVMIFTVSGFKNWFFLIEMIVIGLLGAGVILRGQSPR